MRYNPVYGAVCPVVSSADHGDGDSDSDEEWVATADDMSSATSRHGLQTKPQQSCQPAPNGVSTNPSEDHSITVTVPPLEKTQFNSWDEFHEKVTFQSFRVRTNNKVTDRNKRIRTSGSKAPLVPESWGNYAKTIVCTHAGTYKSRGQGKRKRQHSRSLQCEAQIDACVQVVHSDGPKFALRVTSTRLSHNHHLSKRTFDQYPENRNALEPDVIKTVNELRKAGAKKKNIMKYIMIELLPPSAQKGFRVGNFEPGLGVQTDIYSCGIYLLLAFEIFCGAEPLGLVDRQTLQCMRYRYLQMCA